MTESGFTQKLLKALRGRLPSCVVQKHADRFTAGIPDFSVSYGQTTLWFENKVVPSLIQWSKSLAFIPLQWQYLYRLRGAGHYILMRQGDGHCATFTVRRPFSAVNVAESLVKLDVLTFDPLVQKLVGIIAVSTTAPDVLVLCAYPGCGRLATKFVSTVATQTPFCSRHVQIKMARWTQMNKPDRRKNGR